ncbi:fasciclin domain-containing protein [Colletotrichum scovillei]|nr:fasciclin domain-containing protein [Colletotrichum scovillei]KAF4780444.1 fasciclin domain-containing protein [Colletotrichum scovillei]
MEPADLARILQYHVLMNQVRFTTGVATKMGYKSLMGEKVSLRKEDTTVFANSAKVTIKDIITSDGVMHVIDSVLNPASPKLSPGTSTAAFPGAVQAANAPFTDGVKPTANFTPAGASSRSFDASLKFAMMGFMGSLAVAYL